MTDKKTQELIDEAHGYISVAVAYPKDIVKRLVKALEKSVNDSIVPAESVEPGCPVCGTTTEKHLVGCASEVNCECGKSALHLWTDEPCSEAPSDKDTEHV